VPLKATAVAPVKLVPVIVTAVPEVPVVGSKLVMDGSGPVTLKLPLLVAVPFGVLTVIGPVVAPVGTVALIWVSEATV
jgi:hypothetical protein